MRSAHRPGLVILCLTVQTASAQRMEATRALMGTEFRIVVHADGGVHGPAINAITHAFERVQELERVFSDFDPESDVSRLVAAGGGISSPDLLALLKEAERWHERTNGAFDVALGNLTRLWRRAIRRQELPDSSAIRSALKRSGWHLVSIDGDSLTLRNGVRLDFGGIAKGYAADEALQVLIEAGFPRSLVDAGGDLRLGDPPPANWQVALPDGRTVSIANRAVASSGDHHRHVDIDGRRFSHILDPDTGLGTTDRRTVTVIAPTATEADALASALSVMPLSEAESLVRSLGYSAYIERPGGIVIEINPIP